MEVPLNLRNICLNVKATKNMHLHRDLVTRLVIHEANKKNGY